MSPTRFAYASYCRFLILDMAASASTSARMASSLKAKIRPSVILATGQGRLHLASSFIAHSLGTLTEEKWVHCSMSKKRYKRKYFLSSRFCWWATWGSMTTGPMWRRWKTTGKSCLNVEEAPNWSMVLRAQLALMAGKSSSDDHAFGILLFTRYNLLFYRWSPATLPKCEQEYHPKMEWLSKRSAPNYGDGKAILIPKRAKRSLRRRQRRNSDNYYGNFHTFM